MLTYGSYRLAALRRQPSTPRAARLARLDLGFGRSRPSPDRTIEPYRAPWLTARDLVFSRLLRHKIACISLPTPSSHALILAFGRSRPIPDGAIEPYRAPWLTARGLVFKRLPRHEGGHFRSACRGPKAPFPPSLHNESSPQATIHGDLHSNRVGGKFFNSVADPAPAGGDRRLPVPASSFPAIGRKWLCAGVGAAATSPPAPRPS